MVILVAFVLALPSTAVTRLVKVVVAEVSVLVASAESTSLLVYVFDASGFVASALVTLTQAGTSLLASSLFGRTP